MITRDTVVRMFEAEFLSILMRDHGFTVEQAEVALQEARDEGIVDRHVSGIKRTKTPVRV